MNPYRAYRPMAEMLEVFSRIFQTTQKSRRTILTATVLAVLLPSTGMAQSLYWDTNGITPGSGGATPSGTWDAITPNWTTDSTGQSATTTWVGGDTAIFSAGSDATGSYTISLSGTQTVNAINFNTGTATLAGGTLQLTGSGGVVVNNSPVKGIINSPIIGSAGLTKTSTGELLLSGINTFTGNLTNKAGTITLNNNQAAGAGSIMLIPVSPVELHSSLNGTALPNNIALLGSGSTIEMDADANNILELTGVVSGPHNWNVNGLGTLELAGTVPNTFSGVLTVQQGTLEVAADGALGGTLNSMTVNSGATLTFSGGIDYKANNKVIVLNGTGVGGGAAMDSTGGDNTYEATTVLNTGSAIGAEPGSSLALVGPVTGSFQLTKVGTGTLTLSSSGNSYTTTLVSSGTLDLASGTSGGSGLVTVSGGAVLAGDTSAGDPNPLSGGVSLSGLISPGDGLPATLVSGPETWNGGSAFDWTINDVNGNAGSDPGYAQLQISGALTSTATAVSPITIDVSSLDPSTDLPGDADNFDNTAMYQWTIASATGGIAGFNPAAFTINTSGFFNPLGNGVFILQTNSTSLMVWFVQKPQITTGPANQTVDQCTNVTFSVVATGSGTLHYQWFFGSTPVGTDSPTFSILGVSTSQAGSYSVVVSNLSGATATASAMLSVLDPPPIIVGLPANITTNTSTDPHTVGCSQNVYWVAPGVVDNCLGATLSTDHPIGSSFPVGVTTVTYTATDSIGQQTMGSFTVTVVDKVQPLAVFNSISVQLDATGNYTLTSADVANIAAGSSDECAALSSTNVTPSSFTFCDVGAPKVVTLTLTDTNGNTTVMNSTITVLAPVNPPAMVYVDATYGACNGSVSFPNSGNGGSHFIGYDAFTNIQAAVNAVASNGTVTVTTGMYSGNVAIAKPLSLIGPNQGVGGCASRGTEGIINGGSGTAVSITTSNVLVDGFEIEGAVGVADSGGAGVAIQNNAINTTANGVEAMNIATATGVGLTIQNNCITLAGQTTAGGAPTLGVEIYGVTGAQAPLIVSNNIQGAFYGYQLYGLNASVPTIVNAGTVLGAVQGVAVFNVYPPTYPAQTYSPSLFSVSGVGMSAFSGGNANVPQAGVYCLTVGSTASAVLSGSITNVNVTGVGNFSSDCSGVDLADFSTGAGVRQNITIINSEIYSNANRGIYTSGANVSASVTGCSLVGNGFNPVTGNGNYGFAINARSQSLVGVTNCFIANPAVSTANVYCLGVQGAAGTTPLTVVDCSIVNNGNPLGFFTFNLTAEINAPGNWWGTTNDVAIASLMPTPNLVDFTPYLDSGTDTDLGTPGFQGDFGALHVTTLGTQTGAVGRVQEGINAVNAKGTVFVQPGTYTENATMPAEISLVGSGNGIDPGSAAIINGGAGTAITIAASGAAANDRLQIENLQVTGNYGIEMDSAVSHITLAGVAALNCGNYGVELHNNANVNDLALTGCYLENNTIGLRTSSSAQLNGLSIQGGIISGGQEGIYFTQNGSSPYEVVDNVTINGTAFSGSSIKGIYAETLSDAVLENLTFNNCGAGGANGAGININEKYTNFQNIMVTNCDFSGCGTGDLVNGAAVVIEARDDSPSYSAVPATLTGVALAGLNISGSPDAIRFGEVGKNNQGPHNVTVRDCSLINCPSNGLWNASLATVDAVSNWWGNISGPSGTANPYGTGSGVSGTVTFAPWLGDGTDTSVAVGFQPNTSPTYLPPSQLVFSPEPGGASLGSPLSPQPVVQIEDANGNITPWANPQVACSIGNNPGSGVLTGLNPVQAVNGIASFSNLAITVGGGSGYTLVASAPNLPSTPSTGFDIGNPVPAANSLNPYYIRAGSAGFSLSIIGSNFVPASVAYWNGNNKTTHYVSSTQITADILASDVTSVGTSQIYVVNPTPGGGTSGQLTFRIVAATPAVTYVDHSYTGFSADTQVNWPYTGTGTNIVGYDAFATVQGGITSVATNGSVNVAAGNYSESDLITKPLSLLGANVGTAGCSHGPESYINAGSGGAITILSTNVVVDGFELAGATGVVDAGFAGVTVRNNTINAGAVGVEGLNIAAATDAGFTVQNNCITLAGQIAASKPTVGIGLNTFTGSQAPLIQSNNIQNAFYGYLLYGMNASTPSLVDGGTISGVVEGVAVINVNPLVPGSYGSSLVSVSDLNMSGFTGTYPGVPQAGIYVYTTGTNLPAVITGTISNVNVTGVGNISADSSGVDLADFTTNSGVRQNITIVNSDIHDNANRGVMVSGSNATAQVLDSTISGNGNNPYGTGGNPGFGIIARNNSQVSVQNCFIVNPPTVTAPYTVTALEADANTDPQGPVLVVTDSSILNNSNPSGRLAGQSAGTLNASGNWWGTTDDTSIASSMTGQVDFTPYLDSGVDTDSGTSGFQGDLSTLHVTTLGTQTGGTGRVQEGVNTATSTVIVQAGTYNESVVINTTGLTLKSAQNAGVDARGSRNAESIMASTAAGGTIEIAANNVTVDGMNTAAAGTIVGVNVDSGAANATIINTITGGGNAGIAVSGTATVQFDVASTPANNIGILASGSAKVLVQNNNLSGDTTAGIEATGGAIVDAGDCTGGDTTGLGSSAGNNNLSGYGFDGAAPWAIANLNSSGPAVLAYENNFGAGIGNNLSTLFTGNVLADQSGGLLVQYPAALNFQCLSNVPAGATSLAGFVTQGGTVSATAVNVSFSDSVVTNTPNNRVVTRTYTLSDTCGQTASGTQIITVDDNIPPMVSTWPANETLDVNDECAASVPDLTLLVVGASDNCLDYHITQNPLPGTHVSLGATNVLVTVSDDGGNSVSSNITLNVVNTNPAAVATFVDTNYANLPNGTVVGFPYLGGGTHYVGCDAFGTIQAGIDHVASGGMVNVAAGVYAENDLVNKSVVLMGPNAGVDPNTGTRGAEAIVIPAVTETSGQGSTSGVLFRLGSGSGHVNIIVNGFTFDGSNPNLTDGLTLNGVSVDTGAAIVNSTGSFDANPGSYDTTVTVQNNIVRNFERYGVLLDSTLAGTPTAGNDVSHNLFDNLPAGDNFPGGGRGRAAAFEDNTYGVFAFNVATRVNVGWQDDNYYLPSPGAGTLVASNTIATYHRGIFHNLQYEGASAATILGNNISVETQGDYPASPNNFGIELLSIESAVSESVIGNTVSNNVYGIQLWNTPSTGSVLVQGGTLSGNQYGVWATSSDPQFAAGAASTNTIISGVTVVNATKAGIAVDNSQNIAATSLTITTNTVATSNPVGILVLGPNASAIITNNTASITGNGIGIQVDTGAALIQNNDLTGNTVAAIIATNGAIVDAGNCVNPNVTGLGTSSGGNNLSGYLSTANAIINANIGGSPIVYADHDNFGAVTVGTAVTGAFTGSVEYSQSPIVAGAPANLAFTCLSEVPAGVSTLADFTAQGGYYAGSTATVSFNDVTNLNGGAVGSGTITRTYTVADGCSVSTQVVQVITVTDTNPPTFTSVPGNMIFNADTGFCSKSNVTWMVGAVDDCALKSVVSIPSSGFTFPKGVTTVTNIATDTSGNVTISNFTVTVLDTQPPVVTTWPAPSQTLDVGGNCSVALPDLSTEVTAADNCGSFFISQFPAAGTFVSLGTTNVLVLVADGNGNAVSNIVAFTVIDTAPSPTATFVDANYASLPNGTVVKFPYGGSGMDHYVGCDAFGTIQGGINRVAANGTVNVAAGNYVEELAISQPLTILGPNASINPNTRTRLPEAVLMPDYSDPDPYSATATELISISAGNVSIKGLTVTGYNPDLTNPDQAGTDLFNAAYGIGDFNGDNSIHIENNIVRNFSYVGVDLESDASSAPTTNSFIRNNLIQNIDYNAQGFGFGVILYANNYAQISDNTLTNVAIGISPQNFWQANPGDVSAQSICSNSVNAQLLGIWVNLVYDTASTLNINNNTSVFEPTNGSGLYGPPEWDAYEITSIGGNAGVVASNNLAIGVSGNVGYDQVGYNIWNSSATGNIGVFGGSVSNVSYGVWLNNYDGYQSVGGTTTASVTGVNIQDASLAGVYVQDDPRASTNGLLVQATVTGNTVVNGSAVGVLVQGTNASSVVTSNTASITGNSIGIQVDTGVALIQDNDLTGNTVAAIIATNGATVDAGNCVNLNVTRLGTSSGGNNLSGYLSTANAIINANTGGSPIVYADHDNFGAVTVGTVVTDAFTGSVEYSQAPAVVGAPDTANVTCASGIPTAANDLAGFRSQGGYYAGSTAMVTSSDSYSLSGPQYGFGATVGNGIITRTYTITDGCSDSTNAVQIITVTNLTPPVLTVVPNIVVTNDPGLCGKGNVVWMVSATATCGNGPDDLRVTSLPASSSTFGVGVTTVTNIALDAGGNAATNMFTVTVLDKEPPMFTHCAAPATNNADASGYAPMPDLTGSIGVMDNCTGYTLNQIPPASTPEFLGTHAVTIWAIDQSGNSNSCATSFTVLDKTPPVITCAPPVTITTLQDKYPYATGYPTATDASDSVTITYTDDYTALTNCDTTGYFLRNWTATDNSGNQSFCTQTITVTDTNTPVFTYVPADITVTNDPGQCGAVVSFAPTAEDAGYFQGFTATNWVSNTNFDVLSLDWNDSDSHVYRATNGADGITAPNGIAYGVIDSSVGQAGPDYSASGAYCNLGGESSWDSGSVQNASPFGDGYRVSVDVYINLNDPAVVNAGPTTGYGWDVSASASDNQANFLSDFIFHTAAYGPNAVIVDADYGSNDSPDARRNDLLTLPDHGAITSSGWYTFQWNFHSDTNSSLAVDVSVVDTNGAVIFSKKLSNPLNVASVDGRPNYLWFIFAFTDKLPIANTVFERNEPVISSTPSGIEFPVGTTIVTNVAADACGNSASATFAVNVLDQEPPYIQSIADIVQGNDPGVCGATVTYPSLVITDNCGIASTVYTPASPAQFDVGTNLVTIVATDIHGNSSTNAFHVIINDTEPPSANVPANIVQANDLNQCGAVVNFILPTETDNCGVSNTVATPPSGAEFPVGTTPVTVVVTDIHGNTATNSFTVTVNDTEPPTAGVPGNIVVTNTPGQCGAAVAFTLPAQTDNCGVAGQVATPPSGTIFTIGTTPVTVVVTDIHSNTASGSFTVTVRDSTITTLVSSTNPSVYGGPVTFTAAVTACPEAIPTGSITFLDGNTTMGVVHLDGTGKAAFTTNSLGAGSHAITAVYSGDVNNYYLASASGVLNQVVTPGGSTWSYLGASFTYNGTAQGPAISLAGSTGATTTNYFGTNYQGVAYANTGAPTNAGIYYVSNTVVADANYNGSTNTQLFVIAQATNSILLASSQNPSTYGLTVNFTATIQTNGVTAADATSNVVFVVDGTPAATNALVGGTATYSLGTLVATGHSLTVSYTGDNNYTNNATAALTQTVNPATPVLSITAASRINYGQPLAASTITGTASNPNNFVNVPGTFSFTSPGTVPTTTTSQSVTFTPFDANNYTLAIGSVVVPITDPAILTQPVSVTNVLGGSAAFSVTASGTPVLAFQWFESGTLLPGATSSTYSIGSIKDSDAGNYTVVVSNSMGVVTSSIAVLTVTHPPVFVTQPTNLVVTQGATATFTVSLNGTSPFTYQWFKGVTPLANVGNVSGADQKKLILTSVTASDAGTYSVFVTNADGFNTSSNATLTVIVPPAITGQPQGLTNNAGTVAVFSVTNSGSASVYRWYQNGTNLLTDGGKISGSSTPTLTISNVLGANTAIYDVVISNAAAAVTSSNAFLMVIDPIITNEPVSLTVNLGSPASFTVGAYGTSPQYQWLKGGIPIAGALGATYAIGSVADTDAASYSVIVSNQYGVVTSAPPATLTVIDPPIITHGPVSLTVNATSNAVFTVSFTGTSPAIQWLKNGVPLANIGNVSGATSPILTLADVGDGDVAGYSVVLSNAANVVTSTPPANLFVIDPPVIAGEPQSRTNNAGTIATFTVTFTGTAPAFQWLKNGIPLSNTGNVSGVTSATLTLANVQDSDVAGYSVILSNAANVVTSSPAATLTVIDAPVITGEPQSRTNNAGTTATFTVTFTGTAPAFQWLKDGVPLSNTGNVTGAFSATLSLANVQNGDVAGYSVILSNAANVVTSTPPATLTVIDPPVITQQPVSITNNADTTATFTVVATGTSPIYQWYKNGTNALANSGNVYGADTATLTLSNVFGVDAAVYSVVISNAAATLVSTGATLTVVDPIIAVQPVGSTNVENTTATFSVTAVGTAPLSYQWYQDGFLLDGQTYSNIVISHIEDSDAGDYTVVITNIYGSVTSTPAALVTIPPLIVSGPNNQIAFLGETINFSVEVNGQTPFSYQWVKDGTNIMGATSRILTIANATPADAGSYRVDVFNPIGMQLSTMATLTVYTSSVPVLTIVGSNQVQFVRLDDLGGLTCEIQGSSNLLDWVTLQTNTAPFVLVDTNGIPGAYFYRGIYLP